MSNIVKRIIVILVILALLTAGILLGFRPWWLGYETTKRVGFVQNVRLVERPLCKYWEGTFIVNEPGRPQESFLFWVDTNQKDLSDRLALASNSFEKIEVQYQHSVANRIWVCTPNTGQLLVMKTVPQPPITVPIAPAAPIVPSVATPEPKPPIPQPVTQNPATQKPPVETPPEPSLPKAGTEPTASTP